MNVSINKGKESSLVFHPLHKGGIERERFYEVSNYCCSGS